MGSGKGEADRKGGSDSGGKDWGLESSQSLQRQILAGMPHCSLPTSAGSAEFSLQEPALSPFGLGGEIVTEPREGSGPEGLPEPQTRQGGMREKFLCFPLLLPLSLRLGPPFWPDSMEEDANGI